MNFVIKSRVGVWMMAAGALAALPVMAAEPKIGVVDFQRLAIESPQGKAVMLSERDVTRALAAGADPDAALVDA